jgi:hypothetical protein
VNRRPLITIAAEIATSLKREVGDVVKTGGLLAEAKEQLDHGDWLPWLEKNFPPSARSAQRYMAAAEFAAKYDSVAHLHLEVSALFALLEADQDGHFAAVQAALEEAKVTWVSAGRVWSIVADLRRAEGPDESGDDDARPSDESGEEQLPASDGDGGSPKEGGAPPPDDDRPPPAPPPSLTLRQAAQLQRFESAAKDLLGLAAKPAREFLATAISDFNLETLANFLQQVAREKLKVTRGA